jgi:urea transport system substrate-binding protein
MTELNSIPVGLLHSSHGTMAIGETPMRDVLLMEIERVNRAGGLLGRRVEPIVVDPASDWMAYRDLAHQLIHRHDVQAIFGCWTSSSRKSVLPVVEEADRLLFYPVQYEGEELSRNIFYFGATPNQQAIPALEHLISTAGGGFRRFMFLGTDYVYPRVTNRVLRLFLEAKGFETTGLPEHYVPFGHRDWDQQMEHIHAFVSEGRGAIISTLNGDTNLSFYKALRQAGYSSEDLPVMAFSISEAELEQLAPEDVDGHFACCSYFMSSPTEMNTKFIKEWQSRWDHPRPVFDAMVATLISFRMWCKAVTAANTTATSAVRQYMYGQTELSLTGKTCTMGVNHHLNLTTFVGRANRHHSFDIVWESARPILGDPFAAATIIADTRAANAQRELLEAMPTPLLVVGDDSEVRFRTPSTHRYFGSTIEKNQISEIRAAAHLADGEQQTADLRIKDRRGRVYHMTAAARPLTFEGQSSYLVSLADVTHIREIEERLRVVNGELRHLATTDPLTNISNRRHFLESVLLSMEALREQKRPSAMFMLDVDVFKDVNDHYGHDVGDQVLVEIVQMARLTLRKTDLFGRLGGDEFAGLLLDADTAQAFAMLDRLRSKLASIRINAEKEVVSFTASIGMTSVAQDDSYESALKRADEALYKAKETGRNRVFIGAQ